MKRLIGTRKLLQVPSTKKAQLFFQFFMDLWEKTVPFKVS